MKNLILISLVSLGIAHAQVIPTIETSRVEKLDPDGVPVVEITQTQTLPKPFFAVATARAETVATINMQGKDSVWDCKDDLIPPDGCDSTAPPPNITPCGWWRLRKLRLISNATCPPNTPQKFTYWAQDRCDHSVYRWLVTWQPISWTGKCDRTGYMATTILTAQYPDCAQGAALDVICCLTVNTFTITAAGTNFNVADIVHPGNVPPGVLCGGTDVPQNWGVNFQVDAVDGNGGITALHLLLSGIGYTEPPPNPVALSGGYLGNGALINCTWHPKSP